MHPIRLGVNVDHVATLRQARGTAYPDPVEAGMVAAASGADSITIHLREDRRHIQDQDARRMLQRCPVPVNLEIALTAPMIELACSLKPRFVCLVPERREERTTEGGLDVAARCDEIADACGRLGRAGIEVALFVAPEPKQLEAVRRSGAPQLEIHTGTYADARGQRQQAELKRIATFAGAAHEAGIEVHAGHGLHAGNLAAIARIAPIVELNIGHSIVARSVFVGLPAAVMEVRRAMTEARDS